MRFWSYTAVAEIWCARSPHFVVRYYANGIIATFNEKLLLGQGLAISPLKDGSANPALAPKSLYEVVSQIDNEKDFNEYVLSHERNPAAVTSDQIQYKRHPVSPACTDAGMFLAKS